MLTNGRADELSGILALLAAYSGFNSYLMEDRESRKRESGTQGYKNLLAKCAGNPYNGSKILNAYPYSTAGIPGHPHLAWQTSYHTALCSRKRESGTQGYKNLLANGKPIFDLVYVDDSRYLSGYSCNSLRSRTA